MTGKKSEPLLGLGTDDADQEDHPNPEKPCATESTGSLDMERLNAALQVDLQVGELEPLNEFHSPDDSADKMENFLNEISEDMLQVLKRLKELETRQLELGTRLEQMSQSHLATARELDILRRDLLGERKAQATFNVFEAVVPSLDSLRIMHRKMHQKRDAGLRRQLQGIMDVLTLILQGLGFEEFQVKLKEPIDLERMHPCGYTEGPPGIVLGLERPGYRTKEKVVRPAGVLIANPVESRAKKTRGGK